MEFQKREYNIYGDEASVAALSQLMQDKLQKYGNPLEGLPLECFKVDTNLIAKGFITDAEFNPDAITLQVVEYDHDCEPMIKTLADKYYLCCVAI